MAERGILFSAPMVRALLAGTKTQTRRPMSNRLVRVDGGVPFTNPPAWAHGAPGSMVLPCPYGIRGDRLWVRETWMPDPPRDGTWPHVAFDGCKPRDMSLIPERYRTPAHCLYRADGRDSLTGWTPAIHMFRWASRITLEVTAVRVERLQDISEDDLAAEGIQELIDAGVDHDGTPRDTYRALWETLNGPGSWAANPWVWAVSFKRVTP